MTCFANYRIVPELRIIVSYYSGSLTLKDLIHLNKIFIKDDLFDPSYDSFVDFRDSIAIGFKMDILEYNNFVKSNVTFPKQIKNGIIYGTTNQKFLISIFQVISKLIKLNTQGFDNIEDYFQWMEFDESQKQLMLNVIEELKNPNDNKLDII